MRKIIKGIEPRSLIQHRNSAHSNYDNLPTVAKQTLRENLVSEQRGLCCYCLSKIEPTESRMKIEHFEPQSLYPDKQLIYSNLFGACLGNMKGGTDTHCDTFKGNKEFHFNLCTSGSIHAEIKYKTDGEIYSDNEALNTELNTILNLNFSSLKKARKSALDGFKDYLSTKVNGKLTDDKKIRLRDKWLGAGNSDALVPYCMIVVHYLNKRIK